MTGPVIANQIDAAFGRLLAAHPTAPKVIDCLDMDRPWEIPAEAEILMTSSNANWTKAPAGADLPALKWVQTYSAGIEIYPTWLKQGRIVTNGRGLTAPQIAEYAMAAMLLVEKDLVGARTTAPENWGPRNFGTLEGKVLGIVGFGAIGAETAKRALAFGMDVHASRRGTWNDAPEGITPCASPEEVIEGADHLLLAAPLTPETAGLVNATFLARAKPGLHLINVARGGLVVDADLVSALDSGQLGKATLDVTSPEPPAPDHPFWTHPKVLLTPHESYSGGSERQRFERKSMANLSAFVEGTAMIDVVDLGRGY